jgi:hypothetical protein
MVRFMFSFVVCALVASLVVSAFGQIAALAEHPSIGYSSGTPTDPIAKLQEKIDAGEVTLTFEPGHGYLKSVLEALQIPASSQGLVFSKTSLQLDRIAPWSPRALYFNDEVYAGWVQDGPIMEFASMDPKLGTVFYSLPQSKEGPPRFQRETTTCLLCHDSASVTGGVPGLIVRSMFTDKYGYGLAAIGTSVTTDQTPVEERWGGWYVTGTHGPLRHVGNVMAPAVAHEIGAVKPYLARFDLYTGGNVTDLSSRFDTDPYLHEHSDLVALMVLTHQAAAHNLMTVAGYAARAGKADMKSAAERLVRALLFVKEARLGAPLKGTSTFAEDFVKAGPRDSKGRTLREFDLEKRLFRYPLSYLIYSDSFNALPDSVKEHVYRRIYEVLSGADTSADYAHLAAGDRQAILEILAETKPDVAAKTTVR